MRHLRIVSVEDHLRRVAQDVSIDNPLGGYLAEEMLRIVRQRNALGLAAPQVGYDLNAFVVRVQIPEQDEPQYIWFANARVTPHPEAVDEVALEGCLSLPDVQFFVTRPNRVLVHYRGPWDLDKEIGLDVDGDLARVVQHEYDHCQGRLISDHGKRRAG